MRIECIEHLIDGLEAELGCAGAVGELRSAAKIYLERAYHIGYDRGYITEMEKQFEEFLSHIEEDSE